MAGNIIHFNHKVGGMCLAPDNLCRSENEIIDNPPYQGIDRKHDDETQRLRFYDIKLVEQPENECSDHDIYQEIIPRHA